MRTLVLYIAVLLLAGCSDSASPDTSSKPASHYDESLRTFFAAKEKQAREFQKADQKATPSEVWDYFEAASKGDWKKVSEFYAKLSAMSNQFASGDRKPDERMLTPIWQTINETFRAYEQIVAAEPKHIIDYGRTIIESVPPGSVYLSGTDSGRFVVTFLAANQSKAEPFFILTQNALADGLYLDYVRKIYGPKGLNTISPDDSAKGFGEYLQDVTARSKHGKLKPEESLTNINGRVQVSGADAVMGVNGYLLEALMEKNPAREFYIDQSSIPIELHSRLSPHGLIFKLHRAPLKTLPEEDIERDRQFWTERTSSLIGPWLTPQTTLQEVSAFANRIFFEKNLEDFRGDPDYIKTAHTWSNLPEHLGAAHAFGKARAEIAQLYASRITSSNSSEEKARFAAEADFAFRQAVALCPYHPKTMSYYLNFLTGQNRLDDALLLTDMFRPFHKDNPFGKWLSEASQKIEQSRKDQTKPD